MCLVSLTCSQQFLLRCTSDARDQFPITHRRLKFIELVHRDRTPDIKGVIDSPGALGKSLLVDFSLLCCAVNNSCLHWVTLSPDLLAPPSLVVPSGSTKTIKRHHDL